MTEIGSTLGGRYCLVELLGEGGMARIYRARDAQLERDVAVKLLRPEVGRDPDFLARFRDEARSAASLNHPNITHVFDFGQGEAGPYLVMELVEGQDLASLLRDGGPLQPRQAARVAAEVAKALHVAHLAGLVHRDVKPSNILVGRDGRIKVADFGIARALTESQLTLPGVTLGSVHYFSPEQARGEPATAASDVYALGIVLHEALTGTRPFGGDGAASIAIARLTTVPPPPSALRAGIPAELDAVVARAMALDPADRFPTAAAMAAALEGWLAATAPPRAATPAAPAGGPRDGAAPPPPARARGGLPADPGAARTVAVGRARPGAGIEYPPDAYATSAPPRPPAGRAALPPEDERPNGPWAWIAGILGVGILALVGVILFNVLAGGAGPSPSATLVEVPRFVGLPYAEAEALAEEAGLVVVRAGSEERLDVEPDLVLTQDPLEGAFLAPGSEVRIVVARGRDSVAVPDLRSLAEADALTRIVQEGLAIGARTEAYDAVIPAGSVIDQNPGPGILVAPGTPVAYVVSLGPEPTASPSPSPTPSPSPSPTPTPTPGPQNVGNYLCLTQAGAKVAIEADGFVVGTVTTTPADVAPIPETWIVVLQSPPGGPKQPWGTPIDLVFGDPADPAAPGCP